jgi:hypothetical protein
MGVCLSPQQGESPSPTSPPHSGEVFFLVRTVPAVVRRRPVPVVDRDLPGQREVPGRKGDRAARRHQALNRRVVVQAEAQGRRRLKIQRNDVRCVVTELPCLEPD